MCMLVSTITIYVKCFVAAVALVECTKPIKLSKTIFNTHKHFYLSQ